MQVSEKVQRVGKNWNVAIKKKKKKLKSNNCLVFPRSPGGPASAAVFTSPLGQDKRGEEQLPAHCRSAFQAAFGFRGKKKKKRVATVKCSDCSDGNFPLCWKYVKTEMTMTPLRNVTFDSPETFGTWWRMTIISVPIH